MRDKLDKELDLVDPIEAFDLAIKENEKRLQELMDELIISLLH